MEQESGSRNVKEFTDLIAWQEGHKVVLLVYALCKKFPAAEKFGLISQMQRASVSVTSNIAEGFGRRNSREKVQFYYMAHGSLTELKNLLLIAKDVDYISEKDYINISAQLNTSHALLQGLLRVTKSRLDS